MARFVVSGLSFAQRVRFDLHLCIRPLDVQRRAGHPRCFSRVCHQFTTVVPYLRRVALSLLLYRYRKRFYDLQVLKAQFRPSASEVARVVRTRAPARSIPHTMALRGLTLARSLAAEAPAVASLVRGFAVELKPPPYALDALEPHMSKTTLEVHWGKHHRTYVDNLNGQIAGSDLDSKSLEEIVVASWNAGKPTAHFNNAAQVWNHTFFWESMAPNKGGEPAGALAEAIKRDFGSLEEFKKQFKAAGATQFGSGWAWLNSDKSGKLSITKTPNAENPVVHGQTPILTVDVWEHAYVAPAYLPVAKHVLTLCVCACRYYIDVHNRRPDYLTTYVDKLINWDAVAARYSAAQA
jgi:superoxide dismutase, Fe-Mn family